MAVEDWH